MTRCASLIGILAVFTALAGVSRTALAHGDASIPLYVADDGSDTGKCSDPAAPCRTLGYALQQAAKGTQVRVAAGVYPVSDTGELFLLVSGVVDVVGGYDRAGNFSQRGNGVSTLTGVPENYRTLLRDRGFHVIADQKGTTPERIAEAEAMLSLHSKLQKGAASGPCVNGMAGSLVCDDVDLLSHIALADISAQPASGNDVWGFTDLNTGREYVVAGFNIGTGVFDISDPEAPREVGFIDGQNASWRDIKIYQHYDDAAGRWHAYAYVTTDGSTDGLFVIDLGGLPHRVERVAYSGDFFSAHNVYSSGTDFSTGLPLTASPHLVIAGSNVNVGQFRAYSLSNPAAPAFIPGSTVSNVLQGSDRSYMHDAASLLIRDSRKDSQCVNATAEYCELLLDFNEQATEIWDITDASDPVRLNPSRQEYNQRGYVHSGWWTEDRQYMFVHDELDEQGFNLNTTLRVFSLANLASPAHVGTWTGPTRAIDHNGFVRGNRYYMSNYSRGLTVLDISDPTNPVAVGRLDTYPFSDNSGFIGAWGAYPFFPSGTVAISDINSGVYLARDRTRDTASGGRLGFSQSTWGVAEGASEGILVNRAGGTSGAVSVDVEAVYATADSNDVIIGTTTIGWADGDSSPQSISLSAVADGNSEALELLLLRLVNPVGAALGDDNTAKVFVAEAAAPAELRFLDDAVEIAERGFATAVLVLQREGSASGAVSVDYAVSGGDATPGTDFEGTIAGTVSWADGEAGPKWIEFAMTDDGIAEDDETFTVQLSNPAGATITGSAVATVTVKDGSGINLPPNAAAATGITVAENAVVTLDGSQSNDPDGDPLAFAWAQTAGPTVTLSDPASAITQFTAPSVSSDALLRFRLTVSDSGGLSDSTTVSVTVTDSDGGGGGGGGQAAWLLLLAAGLLARRQATRTGSA